MREKQEMGARISIKNLHKSFGDTEVLRGFDLEVSSGELVCLIGRSGCGKSTLLRCLNGLERADVGEIQIGSHHWQAGQASSAWQKWRLDVGFVFQQFQLFPHLTLLENVALAPRIVKGLSRAEALQLAAEWISKVQLFEHRLKMPGELSGGQSQRGAMARALAMKPQVMLYDEPTSALDPELVGEVLQTMKELDQKEDITQIVVTHEMQFARQAADRVVFIETGRVVEQGPADEVLLRPQTDGLKNFLQRFLR